MPGPKLGSNGAGIEKTKPYPCSTFHPGEIACGQLPELNSCSLLRAAEIAFVLLAEQEAVGPEGMFPEAVSK